jgi:hypothetical protein
VDSISTCIVCLALIIVIPDTLLTFVYYYDIEGNVYLKGSASTSSPTYSSTSASIIAPSSTPTAVPSASPTSEPTVSPAAGNRSS